MMEKFALWAVVMINLDVNCAFTPSQRIDFPIEYTYRRSPAVVNPRAKTTRREIAGNPFGHRSEQSRTVGGAMVFLQISYTFFAI